MQRPEIDAGAIIATMGIAGIVIMMGVVVSAAFIYVNMLAGIAAIGAVMFIAAMMLSE